MKTALLIVCLGALLLAAVGTATYAWVDLGEVDISWHGIAALVLGAVLSLALGVGLMFLVFYSSRHGHDDEAGR